MNGHMAYRNQMGCFGFRLLFAGFFGVEQSKLTYSNTCVTANFIVVLYFDPFSYFKVNKASNQFLKCHWSNLICIAKVEVIKIRC